jgi:C4-dicarboxylate transporter, DctM subunit
LDRDLVAVGSFIVLFVLMALRVPVGVAMGLVGVGGFALLNAFDPALNLLGLVPVRTGSDYGLSVVPLFILMGLFVNKGGLSRELYSVSYAFLGHLRGGLAMATILACGLFSAICGSSLATAATMSKVAMPQMRRFGYDDRSSTASIAAGGTLGILIPPSVILVIYGLLTETSIGKLFIAGIVPGLIGILFYMLGGMASTRCGARPALGPAARAGFTMAERLAALTRIWGCWRCSC